MTGIRSAGPDVRGTIQTLVTRRQRPNVAGTSRSWWAEPYLGHGHADLRTGRHRTEVAGALGGGRHLPRRRRTRRRASPVLQPADVPVPVGRPAHGPRR